MPTGAKLLKRKKHALLQASSSIENEHLSGCKLQVDKKRDRIGDFTWSTTAFQRRSLAVVPISLGRIFRKRNQAWSNGIDADVRRKFSGEGSRHENYPTL